jgi:hypothetical protein
MDKLCKSCFGICLTFALYLFIVAFALRLLWRAAFGSRHRCCRGGNGLLTHLAAMLTYDLIHWVPVKPI